MSDEPLHCILCGAEDWSCGHDPHGAFPGDHVPLPPREKRYCEVCGVIPAMGMECKFYKSGGNNKGCSTIGSP